MVNHTNTHMHECNRIDVHVSQTAANITESDNEITTEDGHPGHLLQLSADIEEVESIQDRSDTEESEAEVVDVDVVPETENVDEIEMFLTQTHLK